MLLLIRYGEIHLKGLNRPYFEKLQRQAIKRALRGFSGFAVEKGQGRFYVTGIGEGDMPRAVSAVKKVFGLHSVSPAVEMEKDMDAIREGLLAVTREYMAKKGMEQASFKVEATRADKRFPLRSPDIAAQVGGYLLENIPGLRVDVHDPDFKVYVEVREQCYGYCDVFPCVGGMPQKSNGRAMLLLSGGIDSPVAGVFHRQTGRGVKRGALPQFPVYERSGKAKGDRPGEDRGRLCGADASAYRQFYGNTDKNP